MVAIFFFFGGGWSLITSAVRMEILTKFEGFLAVKTCYYGYDDKTVVQIIREEYKRKCWIGDKDNWWEHSLPNLNEAFCHGVYNGKPKERITKNPVKSGELERCPCFVVLVFPRDAA